MAHSSSFKKGQVPVQCGLCKNERPIHFKCMECGDLLCTNCKSVHEKIKMTERHNIIEIKDIGHFIPKINLTNIPCKYHSGQSCCLFCYSCDRVVCPTCIAKSHKSHELVEIETAYDMKKTILNGKVKSLTTKMETSKIKQQKFVELKDQKTTKLIKTRQAINENEQILKAEVERLTKVLLQNLDRTDAKINKKFEKVERELKRFRSETEGKMQDNDHLNTTTNGAEFFQKIDDMIKSLDDTPEPTTSQTYILDFKFVQQELTNIGEIQTYEVPVLLDNERFEWSVMKEYKTGLKDIRAILPYQGDKLLIGSDESDVLQSIQLTGDEIRVLSSIKTDVNGIASFNDDIIITNDTLSTLQRYNVSTNNLSDSPFDVSPLRPNAIHVTESNQIIVGAFNADYPVPGRRAVIIMNSRGKKEATYEHDDENQPIFGLPISITTTDNGHIMVSDHDFENEEGGRVIVFDNKGQVVDQYKGHRNINQEKPFIPQDIVTTPEDTVIVADRGPHFLHLLDNQGSLLTLFNLKDVGILLPESLAFSDSKHLYIGCETCGDDEKREAKLYKVELSF